MTIMIKFDTNMFFYSDNLISESRYGRIAKYWEDVYRNEEM